MPNDQLPFNNGPSDHQPDDHQSIAHHTDPREVDELQSDKTHSVTLANRLQLAQEIAKLVRTRLPLTKALEHLSGQTSGSFSQTIEAVNRRLQAGHSLSGSLAQSADAPTRMLAASIELGERAGTLDQALDLWADYFLMQQQFNRRLTSAIVYPLLLVLVALVSILYSAWKLIPQYKQAFAQLAETQPTWLHALEFLDQHFVWFAVSLVCIVLVVLWRSFGRRQGKDRLGIPRSEAMEHLFYSRTAKMCALGLMSGQAVSNWVGLVLQSMALKPDEPAENPVANNLWSRRLGKETNSVLVGLIAGHINSVDCQSLLQTIAGNSATQANLAMERQVQRWPIVTSFVVAIVAVATYLCLIYLPWLALYYHIARSA